MLMFMYRIEFEYKNIDEYTVDGLISFPCHKRGNISSTDGYEKSFSFSAVRALPPSRIVGTAKGGPPVHRHGPMATAGRRRQPVRARLLA